LIGGGISYVSGGLNHGDWFNGKAAFNLYNGASSSVAGYNTGLIVTAATGGCVVCGYAAGSLVGSGVSDLNNGVANNLSGGKIGNSFSNSSLGVGPASYTFGGGQGSGFNFATPDQWDSPAGIFNSSLTILSYAGAASSAYGTYGSYERGSLGFQNPFNANSQWSLVGDLKNFKAQSQSSFQAANNAVEKLYNNIKQNFDLKLEVKAAEDPRLDGRHSNFQVHNGKVIRYETKIPQSNPQNPNSWETQLRFDGTGRGHFNKTLQQYIQTPHVHDPLVPGGVRFPVPGELPEGYQLD